MLSRQPNYWRGHVPVPPMLLTSAIIDAAADRSLRHEILSSQLNATKDNAF